jgi:inner membrane transporter RhtA
LTPPTRSPAASLLAAQAIVVSMLSFQTGASLAKTLFPALGALGTVGARVGFAALLLAAIWRPWRTRLRPWRTRLDRERLVAILLYGVVLAAMNTAFYQAIARLPLGVTVAIEFTGPLAVALFASRRAVDLLWVALVVAGLALLLRPAGHALDPVGIVFALIAACGWAAYILCGIRLGRTMRAGPATSFGMLAAALVLLPFALPSMTPLLHDPALFGWALAVAALSSALPYTLELAAMRRMSARGFGILMSLEPAVAALSGLVLLGERLAAARWLGILLVVAASLGSVLCGDRQTPAQETT